MNCFFICMPCEEPATNYYKYVRFNNLYAAKARRRAGERVCKITVTASGITVL